MLKILQIILTITVILGAAYGLFADNFAYLPQLMFLTGLSFLVYGLREFQKGQKGYGLSGVIASLIFIFISIESFFAG